ncbi:hypothetical protein [Roseisolibacter sp. H3M3-2]|uniref:DUF7507 domain-containing protein n=1 Tax=Roseisolibacter sp. H3M3-2 TaxID=3031323 RepID=UPI0023DAA3FA|nr:hypothetical protein [Roseisolibacter sp. H3M3-2]MDF1502551.1 hypothetical protein [Roseisolibacter sp. H3M3-2]
MRHARIHAGAVAIVLAAVAACGDDVQPATAPGLTPGGAPAFFLNNPTPGNPFTQCGNIGTFCTWEFGNINPSKALMREGDATPFRQVINDDPNAASSADGAPGTLYEVQISYKTRHGGKNAYDFITRWDVSEGSEFHPVANPGGSPNPKLKANLCIPPNGEAATSNLCSASGSGGTLQSAEVSSIEIPVPFAAGDPKQDEVIASTHSDAATRVVTVFNAAAGAGQTPIQPSGTPTLTYTGGEADDAQYGILTFRFRTSTHPRGGNFLIAWGGHVAQQSVWGAGSGAANVNGSPYHMQVMYIKRLNANGTDCGSQCVLLGGSRDLQMSANTVQAAPNLAMNGGASALLVCTGTSVPVTFTYTVTNTGNVAISGAVLDDNGTPGQTGDDVSLGTFTNLAVGASQTFTTTRNVSGTVTNTAYATVAGTSVTATASATVAGVSCSIDVTKTPDRASVCSASGLVTYSFTVTNNGAVPLANVTLVDDKLGPITLSAASLAPGASATGTGQATLTQTTTNTATASGTALAGTTVEQTVTDQASATVTVGSCDIQVTKTPDRVAVCAQNGAVTYTYVVSNPGSNELTNVTLVDDVLGPITLPGTTLAAGGSMTATKASTLSQTTTNTVTATGIALAGTPAQQTLTKTAQATVTVLTCSIDVTKTPDRSAVCSANGAVTYTYVVTNTGTAPLSGVTLVDDKVGAITLSQTSLNPGGTATGTGQATLSQTTTNTATASGTALGGTLATTSVTDQASATVAVNSCAIDVSKTPDRLSVCSQNGTVTYTYVVTNTGTAPLTNVDLTDDKLGAIAADLSLAAGASQTFTRTTTLQATTTNVVAATGVAFEGTAAATQVSDQANATVNVVACTIGVTKTPDRMTVCTGEGTQVTYTYVITNTGAAPLSGITLVDDKLGAVTLSTTSLAPGASTTATKAGAVSQTTTNVATAAGVAFDGTLAATQVTNTATATVTAQQCGKGQIAPTQTTCEQFRDGTSPDEPALQAQLRGGSISQVNPGVVFYYGTVTVPAGGNQLLRVSQTNVPVTGSPLPLIQVSGDNQAELYSTSCTRLAFFTLSGALQPNALSVAPGSYIVRIKYAPNSLVGASASRPQFPVNYRWEMSLDNGPAFSKANIDLTLK